jgi:hypothetical protein
MTPLIILSTLTGAILGMRFKIFILVPAIVLLAAFALGIGIARGDGLESFLLALALGITALQIGYLGGAVTRFVIAGARVPRRSLKPATAAQNSAR